MGVRLKSKAILSMTTRADLLQHEKETRMIKEVAGHKEVEVGRSCPHTVLHMRRPRGVWVILLILS